MSGVLAQDIELKFKLLLVELAVLADVSVTVMLTKDDKRLKNQRLLAAGSRAKNRAIRGDASPTEYT